MYWLRSYKMKSFKQTAELRCLDCPLDPCALILVVTLVLHRIAGLRNHLVWDQTLTKEGYSLFVEPHNPADGSRIICFLGAYCLSLCPVPIESRWTYGGLIPLAKWDVWKVGI
jgi:hypothetical protein